MTWLIAIGSVACAAATLLPVLRWVGRKLDDDLDHWLDGSNDR